MMRTTAPGETRGPDTDTTTATILVVDDDLPVLEVACKALSRSGYDVLRASSGREALDVVRDAGPDIDLLLTDVVMPEMSGRELAEAARDLLPDLPVLYMSAYTEDEVILEGVRVAEVDFLAKPFSVQELVEAVETTLG